MTEINYGIEIKEKPQAGKITLPGAFGRTAAKLVLYGNRVGLVLLRRSHVPATWAGEELDWGKVSLPVLVLAIGARDQRELTAGSSLPVFVHSPCGSHHEQKSRYHHNRQDDCEDVLREPSDAARSNDAYQSEAQE